MADAQPLDEDIVRSFVQTQDCDIERGGRQCRQPLDLDRASFVVGVEDSAIAAPFELVVLGKVVIRAQGKHVQR